MGVLLLFVLSVSQATCYIRWGVGFELVGYVMSLMLFLLLQELRWGEVCLKRSTGEGMPMGWPRGLGCGEDVGLVGGVFVSFVE